MQHDCPTSRAIGYFLEPVIMLAPFAKRPMNITVKGITTDEHDLSVRFHNTCQGNYSYLYILKADILRTVTLPHLQLFGISEGLELRVCKFITHYFPRGLTRNKIKIKKRGDAPAGGGEVQFLCPIVKQVKTLNFVDPGKIKRIRGVA
jgi:RNA 3'-terminal phosphate cyclase-like protein